MKRPISSVVTCLFLTMGCTAAPAPPAELSEDDRAAIQEYFDELARSLSPEDNEAWANTFTQDGLMMFGDSPTIRGREALQAWGEATGEAGSPVALSVTFADIEIHGSGDVVWTTSIGTAMFEGVEESVTMRQLIVLERQADGRWLAAAAYAGADPPPMTN